MRRRRVGEIERATGCIRALNLLHCAFRHAGSVSRLKRARRGTMRCLPESSRENQRSAMEESVRESAGADGALVDVDEAGAEGVDAEGADAINRVPTGALISFEGVKMVLSRAPVVEDVPYC